MSRQSKAEEALALPLAPNDLPSFTDLFGPTDKPEGQNARSVLSPAAYLVDLLLLRDSLLPGAPEIDPGGYHERRPDVADLPLDEIRTFGEVAHLELSNAIMKTLAERELPGDVRARLATSVFPAPLPFSADHARLLLALPKLGTDAAELYKRYQRPVDGAEVARLVLGFNEQEVALFTTRRDSAAGIDELWGLRDADERARLYAGEVPLVQRKLGLSLKELKTLLFQDLSDEEIASEVASGFFINQGSGGTHLEIQVIPPPADDQPDPPDRLQRSGGAAWDLRQLDRVMRFVRVAKRTGLTFAELDWLLQSSKSAELDGRALQVMAIARTLQRATDLPLDEICALWAAPKRHGHGDGAQAADLFDRIFNRGYQVRLEALLASGPSDALTTRLVASLRLSRRDLDALTGALAARGAPAEASLAYVALLYRMATLARALQLPVTELVTLLDLLDAQWLTTAHVEFDVAVPLADPALAPAQGLAAAPARPTFYALAHPDSDAAAVLATLLVLQRVLALKQWADSRQLGVRQLAYLTIERFDDGAPIDGVAPDSAVEEALTELHAALSSQLVSPAELQTGSLSARGAAAVFASLRSAGVLAVVADAATPLPRALVRVQPLPSELTAAMQAGIDERLEVYPSDLRAAGVAAEQLAAVQALLIDRGYLEPAGEELRVGRGTRAFFADRANLPAFFVPELPDQKEALFEALAEKVAAFTRAQAALDVEAAELASRLSNLVEQHQRGMQRLLSGQLGLADDVTGLLFSLVFGTADESPTQTLAQLTLPLFQIKASADPRALANAALSLGFRRLRQLGLLTTKVGMAAEEAQVYFENQGLRFERPDGLKLPADFFANGQPLRVDALLPAPDASRDLLLLSGGRFARFSSADYQLLGTGPLAQLPGMQLPPSFHDGVDSAWRDGDGTTYFTAGDSYVSSTAPSTIRRISDTWGKVRNHLQEDQRIDTALLDSRGRVFLFRGDQYLRYSDASRVGSAGAFADEGYPKSIAGSFEAEGVAPLPGVMTKQLDAAFRDGDGSFFFFAGNRFAHSATPFELRDIRGRWGKVRNHLFDDDRVDAAFVHGDHTYLVRRDQVIRYTGGAYGFSDEGWPVSFANLAEGDALLRVLKRFPQGIEAAMTGRDSALYVFQGGSYASSAAPDATQPIRDRWGKVRNVFLDNARVDAALYHGGKAFLFCGDQYLRYSSPGGTGYQYADEGYPKRVRANWNAVEGIGRIPDGLAEPITATAVGGSDEVYFFAGTQVAAPDGRLAQIKDQWGKVRNNLEALGRVDAALLDSAGKLFWFTGDQYTRYSSPAQEFADEGYPRRLTSGWAQEGAGYALPAGFASGLSAALHAPDHKLYFFAGQQYARVDAAAAPAAIAPHWGVVRNNLGADGRVDAAFRDAAGKVYLFRGDQFCRYSTAALDFVDEGYPQAIATRWTNLPAAFRSGLDEALLWTENGVTRLYFFKGLDYVRFSSGDLTQMDAGYPRRIEDGDDVEGDWFRGLAFEDPNDSHDDDDVGIHAIYLDTYRSQPRINLFYRRDNQSGQWQREYRFESNNRYRWTDHRRMESIPDYAPFTQLDAAVVATDGTLHVFSGDKYASRPPAGGALTTPIFIRDRWGKVRNRIAELGRIDATLSTADGKTYLFTDTQFARYSGALRPGESNFFVDEGYPRTTATAFAAEGLNVAPPAVMAAEGSALCRDATGRIHVFSGTQYTYGGNPSAPVAVSSRWGKVENRLQQLSRVDAALRAPSGKLYLFCDDQLTRYSGALTPGAADFYSDEGYPKKIATGWTGEGVNVALPARFTALGTALLRDAQDLFVFDGNSFTSALVPAPRPLLDHWAKVRNQLQANNRVDAGFVLQRGADAVTLLFCDDQYVRYSGATDGFVDEGYPKRIARLAEVEGTAALPAPFLAGVRGAFAGGDGALHFFTQAPSPGEAQQYVSTAALSSVRAPKEKWGIVENRLFDDNFVDAALTPAGGKLFLFSGDQYVRYSDSHAEFVDETYPRKVSTSWAAEIGAGAIPAVLHAGLDAALAVGATQFYFVGDQVVDSRELATPRPLVERWGRVDNRTQQVSKIDAALVAPDGALLLFTGDQVARYSGAARAYVDEGYPKILATSLARQWPAAFQRDLDSAATFEGRAYFFKGASHLRISDPRLVTPDRDYPRPIADKLVDRRDFTLTALPDAWGFKALVDEHGSPPLPLLQVLQLANGGITPTVEQLAAATRWSADELRFLQAAPLAAGSTLAALPGSGLGDSRTLAALARHFAYADKLGGTPSSLALQLAAKAFGPARDLAAAAELAVSLVKAQTAAAEWPAVERSLREPINAATRDALVALLTHARGLADVEELYEYLLHDVQMGQEATTSPIVEAINSIQLYYHRARMNLEEVPEVLRGELERWWGWMKNYRTWEANRRVFLYPENYIRPELRTLKSDAFEELEQNLMQDEITPGAVEKAYTKYLESFSKVSRLRIAGGYVFRDERDDSYVLTFGFERTEPLTYYYRRGRLPDEPSEPIAWQPWEKLEITINAEKVQPVFAFNRIFLFWMEPQPANDTEFKTGGTYGGSEAPQYAKPVIKYTFLSNIGEWIAPQTLRAELRKDPAPGKTKGEATWLASDLAVGRLYITNPSLKSDYDPEAYIYVLASLKDRSDPLVGRLTAALDFEPPSAITLGERLAITSSIDLAPQFPPRLGLTPEAFSRLGAHFRGVMTAPWFSFDASGGSFLCRPSEPQPISLADLKPEIELRNKVFADVDAGFGMDSGDLYVFTTENGRRGYYRHGAPAGGGEREWQPPVWTDSVNADGSSAWPRAFLRRFFDEQPAGQVIQAVNSGERTYLSTTFGAFTYSSSSYRFVDQELAPVGPATRDQLVNHAAPIADWLQSFDGARSLVNAFVEGFRLVLVTRSVNGQLEYAAFPLVVLTSYLTTVPGAPSGLFDGWAGMDAAFLDNRSSGVHLVITGGRGVVSVAWQSQTWSAGNLSDYLVDEPAISAAFSGRDGALYFFAGERYAEITRTAPAVFRPIGDKWGHFPPLYPDAAVQGLDHKLYLFCSSYCVRFSQSIDALTWQPDPGFPRPLHDLFGTAFPTVTSALKLAGKVYLFGERDGQARYERYSAMPGSGIFHADPTYPKAMQGGWGNLPTSFNLGFDGAVQLYDAQGTAVESIVARQGQMVEYGAGSASKQLFEVSEVRYSIVRLTSNTAARFSQMLLGQGVPGLLSLATQKTQELPRFSTNANDRGQAVVTCSSTAYLDDYPDKPTNPPTGPALDFDSASGFYYWEIFFHIPYLIAQALNQAQRFEEARTWYEYVFDPTEPAVADARAFWKFLPFHDAADNASQSYLEDPDQLLRYRNDPFDPHGLAQLRPIAYRKAFVMSYVDNLLDWGDLLFQQYTRESLGEATMLYVLAAQLLGKRPQETGKRKLALSTMTYQELADAQPLDAAWLELENELPATPEGALALVATPNDSILNPYFFIPENQQFIDYWDRVGDRLFKIRNGLNLDGVKQSLALFAPPIDPAALVKAFASGGGLAQALSDLNAAVPHYRCTYMLAKAKELVGRVTQLGGALLSALEKQDGEELNLLRNTQERGIFELTLGIRKDQLAAAKETAAGLRVSLSSARTRQAHYQRMLVEGLSGFEQLQLIMTSISQGFSTAASVGKFVQAGTSLIPNLGSVFAITFGGLQLGPAAGSAAEALSVASSTYSFIANLASMLGGWQRRSQDWELQRNLATIEVEQITRQINAADIQVTIAQREIQVQQQQIRNNLSIDTFMKSKFTNQQLYRWMVGKLSAVYFQTYQLALEYAKGAQRALAFEMGWPESEAQVIGAYYWESLQKGLLAGERLQLDLDRLEKLYVDKNKRRFEITKTVSLQLSDPLALVNLQQKGSCEFDLNEALFDEDFPGHYCRQIKSISVSFPAVVGPYESFNATLTQLGHRTVMKPDLASVRYLLTGEGDAPVNIRADWRPTQQVALSRGVNDSGLFQLNYQDERFLPFEGTGAVSRWRLQVNGADGVAHRQHLRDVILTVQYTALPGGDDFAEKVKSALPATARARALNFAFDFPAEWQAFLADPSRGLTVRLDRSMLPGITQPQVTGLYLHYELTEEGASAIGRQALTLTHSSGSLELKPGSLQGDLHEPLGTWTLVPTARAERFTAANVKNVALIVGYLGKPVF